MAKVRFHPSLIEAQAEPHTKLLAVAIRAKSGIRFGCSACRCGTCGVRITEGSVNLSAMQENERALLIRMKLSTEGDVRLACQARIAGEENSSVEIDLNFQNQYSPDTGLE